MATKKTSKSTHDKSNTAPKRGGNRRRTSPDMIDVAQRQTEALRLRQSGRTFQEIADELGYSDASGARNAVLAALQTTVVEPNNEVRQLELSRLDALLASLWPTAMTGDQGAIDRILKILERRSKMLGLDAAPKMPVGDIDDLIQAELDRIAGLEATA
jgi:hypothetical protein